MGEWLSNLNTGSQSLEGFVLDIWKETSKSYDRVQNTLIVILVRGWLSTKELESCTCRLHSVALVSCHWTKKDGVRLNNHIYHDYNVHGYIHEAELKIVRGRDDLMTEASGSKDTSGAWNYPRKDIRVFSRSIDERVKPSRWMLFIDNGTTADKGFLLLHTTEQASFLLNVSSIRSPRIRWASVLPDKWKK